MDEKWYVMLQAAEDMAGYVVKLTDAEARAVQKCFDQRESVFDNGWSGNSTFRPQGYATRQEAVHAARKMW